MRTQQEQRPTTRPNRKEITTNKRNACAKKTPHKNSTKPDSLDLNVFYVNARSIRNKFDDLEEFLLADNYNAIGITKSWSNTENRDFLAEYNIPWFTMFEKSRINRNDGGVFCSISRTVSTPYQ